MREIQGYALQRVLGRLLCKLGFHNWKDLYLSREDSHPYLESYEEDELWRYCFRCGKLQRAELVEAVDLFWRDIALDKWRRRAEKG